MSVVTDIVFVTEYKAEAEAFQKLFTRLYTRMKSPYTPYPVSDSGPKCSGAYVFHLGINYANTELMEALREHPWKPGTVLWIHGESRVGPEIHVGAECISRPGWDMY